MRERSVGTATLFGAWLSAGTATCAVAAAAGAAGESGAAITLGAIVGQTFALRRQPRWTEALLALCCVPYFIVLTQWLSLGVTGAGVAFAAASATSALTVAARCVGRPRRVRARQTHD